MARFTIPPLTRVLLLLLIVLSSVVAILRYYTYILLMAEATRKEMELANAAAAAVEQGLTPEPKQVFNVPQPSDLFVPYLTIVPGLSTMYPWVLFTASFVEGNVLSFVFTGSVLLYSGRYCEHIWGMAELARFVGLNTIIPNIVSTLVYMATFSTHGAIDSSTGDSIPPETISGAVALISGFFVAFKQMVPEHTVILFRGAIKIRVARLPAIFLCIYTLFGILFRSEVHTVQAWAGFFVSWIYLRFFRISYVDPLLPFSANSGSKVVSGTSSPSSLGASSSNNAFGASPGPASSGAQAGIKVKGDLSDNFSLAQFFPEPLATAVSFVSTRVFSVLVILRVCSQFDPNEIDAANLRAAHRASGGSYVMSNSNYHFMRSFGSSSHGNGLNNNTHNYLEPRSTRAEAERRRAFALRVLDDQVSRNAVPKPTGNTAEGPSENSLEDGSDAKTVSTPDLKMPNRAVLPPARVN